MNQTFDDFLDEITRGLFSLFGPWSESVEERDWVFEGPVSLVRARTMSGSITVRAVDQAGVTVRAWKTVRGPTEGLAEAFAQRVRVHVSLYGQSLHVHAVYPQPPLGCSVFVRYELSVPRAVDLDLYTQNGGIDIVGVEGAIEAEVWNGNIALSESIGPVELYTSNGDIRAWDVDGAIQAESGNGNVSIEDGTGHIRLRTTRGTLELVHCEGQMHADSREGAITLQESSGSAEIEAAHGPISASLRRLAQQGTFVAQDGSISLQIHGGEAPIDVEALEGAVDLVLPRAFPGHLEAATDRGAIYCDLPLSASEQAPDRLVGHLGEEEGPSLKIHTFAGDIRIHALADDEAQPKSKGDNVQ